jgi:hypothetical protein
MKAVPGLSTHCVFFCNGLHYNADVAQYMPAGGEIKPDSVSAAWKKAIFNAKFYPPFKQRALNSQAFRPQHISDGRWSYTTKQKKNSGVTGGDTRMISRKS